MDGGLSASWPGGSSAASHPKTGCVEQRNGSFGDRARPPPSSVKTKRHDGNVLDPLAQRRPRRGAFDIYLPKRGRGCLPSAESDRSFGSTISMGISAERHSKDSLASDLAYRRNISYSGSDSFASNNGSASRVMLRKMSWPRHRCPTMNGSVTGIVKAPRYSKGGATPAIRRKSNDDIFEEKEEQQQKDHQSSLASRRRSSMPWEIKPGELANLEEFSSDGELNNDSSLHSSFRSSGSLLNASVHSNQSWVPIGVNFNATMEVYVFEK